MRTNLAAGLLYTGTIVLAFGIAASAIGLLGARYGSGHETNGTLAVVLVVAGAILVGASYLLGRRSGGNASAENSHVP